jgi:hypothetical protein
MKRLVTILSIVFVFVAVPAMAQKPATGPSKTDSSSVPAEPKATKPSATASYPQVYLSPGEITATPEMWYYEQSMREYRDPKMAVRRAAEARAEQRERRLAAMKWFGYSNQRPRVNVDPTNTDYAPGWASGNDAHPERWNGVGPTWVTVRPDGTRIY